MSFVSLPTELLVRLFLPFPSKETAIFRLVCTPFRKAIDESPELQVMRVFERMMIVQPECNIPTSDLKFYSQNHQLAVEVGDNLTLFKLVREPSLKATLPWITELFIRRAHPDEVNRLFGELKDSKRLKKIYLGDCGTAERSHPQAQIIRVEPEKTEEFSFPRITSQEDILALETFCKQVEDDTAPADAVLKTMEEVAPPIRGDICTAIWHIALMPITGELQPKNLIEKQVEDYIIKQPHSTAVRAAADKVKRNISF